MTPLSATRELDARSREILDFEVAWSNRRGDKLAAIRAQFGFGSARYYQALFAVLEDPAALRHDPLVVRRLQRLRDQRERERRERTFGSVDPRS